MSRTSSSNEISDSEPVRVLGRGFRVERGVRLTLRTLRGATGKTQVDVARAAKMDQADISRLEARATVR